MMVSNATDRQTRNTPPTVSQTRAGIMGDHPVDQYASRCQSPQPASEDLKRI
jgi:hypothetical protein